MALASGFVGTGLKLGRYDLGCRTRSSCRRARAMSSESCSASVVWGALMSPLVSSFRIVLSVFGGGDIGRHLVQIRDQLDRRFAVVAHVHQPAIERVERLLQDSGFSWAYLSVAIQPEVRFGARPWRNRGWYGPRGLRDLKTQGEYTRRRRYCRPAGLAPVRRHRPARG